jgi:hypothetical protein
VACSHSIAERLTEVHEALGSIEMNEDIEIVNRLALSAQSLEPQVRSDCDPGSGL